MFGHAHKNTTSSYLQPDIRDLQRKGFMRPRGRQMLNWSRAGEVIASLSLRADFDRIVLRYRHQRYGEVWKAEEYPNFLTARHATTETQGLVSLPRLGMFAPCGRPLWGFSLRLSALSPTRLREPTLGKLQSRADKSTSDPRKTWRFN